jgi:hypothetical protein
MTYDAFISYATADEPFAQFLYRHLSSERLAVFLASVSLRPGQQWEETILTALRTSDWVFFLASQKACASAYVQQELGAALASEKKIIPIVWDQTPDALPGWMRRVQAVNLRGATVERTTQEIAAVTAKIKADKLKGQLIAGLLLAGLAYAALR